MPLIMHRTRNKGVTGVKGQYTKGPAYSRDNKKTTTPPPPPPPPPPGP